MHACCLFSARIWYGQVWRVCMRHAFPTVSAANADFVSSLFEQRCRNYAVSTYGFAKLPLQGRLTLKKCWKLAHISCRQAVTQIVLNQTFIFRYRIVVHCSFVLCIIHVRVGKRIQEYAFTFFVMSVRGGICGELGKGRRVKTKSVGAEKISVKSTTAS